MKTTKTLVAIATFLLLISISLTLYPTLSRLIFENNYDNTIEEFDYIVENIQDGSYADEHSKGNIDEKGYPIDTSGNKTSELTVLYKEDIDRLYRDSQSYNNELTDTQDFRNGFEGSALDLSNYGIFNGVYGYISAPTIELNVPIYLGANDYNMRYGATHMLNTSLPIGGKSTTTVLAGHTNYIGRTLFDNIPYLSQGDIVTIKNYFGTLNYCVIDKKNIDESDTNNIYIEKDKDLLVLLTCSNGGITRYIVICERVN